MRKKHGLASELNRGVILIGRVLLHHAFLLEESLCNKPEEISLKTLGSPPTIFSAGFSFPQLGGRGLIILLITGLPLAPTSPCSSFLRHLLTEIDEPLLAHTLGGS